MKSNLIQIRISDKDKKDLKAMAEKRQMTMSELLIYLVRKEAEKETK